MIDKEIVKLLKDIKSQGTVQIVLQKELLNEIRRIKSQHSQEQI